MLFCSEQRMGGRTCQNHQVQDRLVEGGEKIDEHREYGHRVFLMIRP